MSPSAFGTSTSLPFSTGDITLLSPIVTTSILPSMTNGIHADARDYNIDPLLFLTQTPTHLESPLELNSRLFNQTPILHDPLNDMFSPIRPAPASFLAPSFDMLDFKADPMWDSSSENSHFKNLYNSATSPKSPHGGGHRDPQEFSFDNYNSSWNSDSNALHLSLPDEPLADQDMDGLSSARSSSIHILLDGGVGFEAYNRCVRNLQDIHTNSPFAKHYLHPVDSRDVFNKLIASYFTNCTS